LIREAVVSILGYLRGMGVQLRTRHRRRLPFLSPGIERRRPRIQAEDYAARHSIEHTLDRKAELRRLAPFHPEAARRYQQLLNYELDGLRQVVVALRSTSGSRDLVDSIAENLAEIERLEIEVAWCSAFVGPWSPPPTTG
jgi:hypothetical protein